MINKLTSLLFYFCIIMSWNSYAQFPEDFETNVPPAGWVSFRGINNEGTNHDWTSSNITASGSQSAFVRYEAVNNVAEDWLVTPQFTPTSTTNFLTFMQRQNFGFEYNTTFTIRVSTGAQSNIGDFTIIHEQLESDFGITFSPKNVDLSSYIGTPIFVAFVMTQNDGDSWYIDDVNLINGGVSVPNCIINIAPSNNAVGVLVNNGVVSLSWNPPLTGEAPSSYEIYYGEESGNLTFLGETPGTTFDVSNNSLGQTYYWSIVPKNVGGSAVGCAEWQFTTENPPSPPTNDECESATILSVNTNLVCTQFTLGTTVSATESSQLDDVTGFPNNDVWFKFIATSTAHRIELNNIVAIVGASTDMGMAIYNLSGGCDNLTLLDDSDPNAMLISGLEMSIVYLVRVYGWGDGSSSAQAEFEICIGTPPSSEVNDDINQAISLELDSEFCNGNNTNGSNIFATDSGEVAGSCFNINSADDDVWFTFTVPEGVATVDVSTDFTGGTLVDSELAVYSGLPGNLVELGCSQDEGVEILSNGFSWNSRILDLDVTVGETYYVQVAGHNSNQGTFCLEITTNQTLYSKVFLQGPYNSNTGLMTDDLRSSGLLPTTSPYTDALTVDQSVLDVTGTDAIIDWIWVELRASADGTTVVASTSALLQADGEIVDTDGISELLFDVPIDNYYLMISHRNHLGVLTANTVSITSGVLRKDLTGDSTLIIGGTNAIKDMGDGTFALFAGDFNGDGQIQNTDKSAVEPLRGISGYSNADVDMNGEIQNTDLNSLLNPNLGKGKQYTGKKLNAKRKK